MKHLENVAKKEITSQKFDETTYGKILDSLAIACADSILICQSQILLAKRNIEPRANHWALIGGRMIAGENPTVTAKRKLYEETGLDIKDLQKFIFLDVYSAYYSIRKQEPQENGSHTINFTYVVNIDIEEKDKVNLVKSEYQTFQWIAIDRIVDFLAEHEEDIYIKTIIGDAVNFVSK